MVETYRRRLGWWLLIIPLFLVSLLGGYLVSAWRLLNRPHFPEGAAMTVEIARGQTLLGIHQQLVASGLLAPRAPFRAWARLMGRDREIKSGCYELSPAQSPRQILQTLVDGLTLQVPVTIPEGLALPETLERLTGGLGLSPDSLAALASDSAWVCSLGIPVPNLEGYLCPETYHFERGASSAAVLGTLVHGCFGWFDPPRRQRADSLGLSVHEILTLASIIEAETALMEEKPRISAVYHSRLRRRWLLQADPTVAFAAGRIGSPLSRNDLEVDSPYNTYRHYGLPPGPICSPGLASIDAALWPAEDCQDLYFVAQGDGTHIFSRTLRAHNRAKLAVRQGH